VNAFKTVRPLVIDASTNVRRRLNCLHLDTPYVQRVLRIARELHPKGGVRSPCWQGEAVAHLGFPLMKTAIIVQNVPTTHSTVANKKREVEWKAEGWRLLIVSALDIGVLSDERLLRDLREAITQ
jgi:hypothetical protein